MFARCRSVSPPGVSIAVFLLVALVASPARAQTQVEIPASTCGNVADANLDGFGDNHTSLPGCCPIYVSAGVDGVGGAGSNGTRRIQIEFPLSALSAAGVTSTSSATVVVSTFMGTVDSLDTFYYHGTSDQDGVLSDSDFEAPATPIAGVVMPVTPGDSTFSFDVTAQLNADIAAGNSYFSVQGRVDESLIGMGSMRGLQVRTTGTAVPAAQHARLFVLPGAPVPHFIRGDVNNDLSVNLQDPIVLLNYLFPQGPPTTIPCDDAADATDDGAINLQDAVAILTALFGQPIVPLPAPAVCAPDPTTADSLSCAMPSC